MGIARERIESEGEGIELAGEGIELINLQDRDLTAKIAEDAKGKTKLGVRK